ncbi:hypothetical protein E4U19_001246 [Claviceps sp. Clav32 group G5]|nr:hypothetical protein E4U19_001246 [Claviceps sp. Clav32 group G5]
MAFQQPRMHSISSSSDAMTECTTPSIYPDTVAYQKVPYSAYYGPSLLSPTSLTHSPAMQNSQMVLGGAMDQYSVPGTPNDYEMSNWPRTPFEHHGHPNYFGLPVQPEMGPGLEVPVPWQEINYSETTPVVTPKRERRSRSKTPRRNTNGVQKRRPTNPKKKVQKVKQEDVTDFQYRSEGPPLLKEDCPEPERFLINLRYQLEDHKGTDLWERIPDMYEAKFHKRLLKPALQMKIRRARQTFVVWKQEDEEKLLEAWLNVRNNFFKKVLEEFLRLGGSRNMCMNDIDIKDKCQGEEFVSRLRELGINDFTNDFDKDKKPKQARHQ